MDPADIQLESFFTLYLIWSIVLGLFIIVSNIKMTKGYSAARVRYNDAYSNTTLSEQVQAIQEDQVSPKLQDKLQQALNQSSKVL